MKGIGVVLLLASVALGGDLVLGTYIPPSQNELEYRRYAECGFNTVLQERYRVPDFALARKHGLQVILDPWWLNGPDWRTDVPQIVRTTRPYTKCVWPMGQMGIHIPQL